MYVSIIIIIIQMTTNYLYSTIWPRAAAVSERLWTPYDTITASSSTTNIDILTDRIETFRCLLTNRGVSAAPVLNSRARQAPPGPGSCYSQRRF